MSIRKHLKIYYSDSNIISNNIKKIMKQWHNNQEDIIHHIDLNRKNNILKNLDKMKHYQHVQTHNSLRLLLKNLFSALYIKDIIIYDKKNKIYQINNKKIKKNKIKIKIGVIKRKKF